MTDWLSKFFKDKRREVCNMVWWMLYNFYEMFIKLLDNKICIQFYTYFYNLQLKEHKLKFLNINVYILSVVNSANQKPVWGVTSDRTNPCLKRHSHSRRRLTNNIIYLYKYWNVLKHWKCCKNIYFYLWWKICMLESMSIHTITWYFQIFDIGANCLKNLK